MTSQYLVHSVHLVHTVHCVHAAPIGRSRRPQTRNTISATTNNALGDL